MRVLILGCGYVGMPLAAAFAARGDRVVGVRRSWSDPAQAEAARVQPQTADLTRREDLARLPGPFDVVVNCAAAGSGVADYTRVYLEGTRTLLAWMEPAPPQRFIYASSTGVYGQTDGSDVDETSPTEPASPTGRVLVETERLLLHAARERGFPAVLLRVAGIYGPGRGYWPKQVLQGEARIEGDGRRWLNLIHRDDVVGAVLAAERAGRPGEVYNAVDDEPVAQGVLLRWLATRLGRPEPPPVPPGERPAASRGLTHKRVLNRKLKADTGYLFQFPTFREGYARAAELPTAH